ncbi:hypothetical protein ABEF95_012351 [Exophiala dermatitidis]
METGTGTVLLSSPSPTRRRITFTPQQVISLPRAWERRPATPYVRRNEAQKIWKRVPLGVIEVGVGDGGHTWRKENEVVVQRSVKRLRVSSVTVTDHEEDKENMNINYVPVKWDEDGNIPQSPKRKVFSYDGAADEPDEVPDEPSSKIGAHRDNHQDNEESIDDKENLEEELCESAHEDCLVDVALGESEGVTVLDNEDQSLLERNAALPNSLSEETLEAASLDNASQPAAAPSEAAALVPLPKSDSSQQPEVEGEAQSFPNVSNHAYLSGRAPALPVDHGDFPLLQSFLQNYLSRSQLMKAIKEKTIQDAQAPAEQPEMGVQPLAESSDVGMGSFDGTTDTVATERTSPASENEGNSTTATTNIQNEKATLLVEPDEDLDGNVSSPFRRSSRLNSKLAPLKKPVPALPSNIPLKRLNGTEFVAFNNGSIAAATRTNTKRNKGGALSVKARLVQLHAEDKVRYINEPTASEEVSSGKKTNKARKEPKEVKWHGTLARFEDGTEVPDTPEEEEPAPSAHVETEESKRAVVNETKGQAAEHIQEPPKSEEPAKKVRKLRKLSAGTVNGTPAPKRTTSIPVPIAGGPFVEKLADIATNKGKGSQGTKAKAAATGEKEKSTQARPRRRSSAVSRG